jgi:hypothetical protein
MTDFRKVLCLSFLTHTAHSLLKKSASKETLRTSTHPTGSLSDTHAIEIVEITHLYIFIRDRVCIPVQVPVRVSVIGFHKQIRRRILLMQIDPDRLLERTFSTENNTFHVRFRAYHNANVRLACAPKQPPQAQPSARSKPHSDSKFTSAPRLQGRYLYNVHETLPLAKHTTRLRDILTTFTIALAAARCVVVAIFFKSFSPTFARTPQRREVYNCVLQALVGATIAKAAAII